VLPKVEASFAFAIKLVQKLFLCLSVKIKWIFLRKHIIKQNSCSPNVNLLSITVLSEKLRSQKHFKPDNLEKPFFAFLKLT